MYRPTCRRRPSVACPCSVGLAFAASQVTFQRYSQSYGPTARFQVGLLASIPSLKPTRMLTGGAAVCVHRSRAAAAAGTHRRIGGHADRGHF
eukprot:7312783-Prymnesium_polylepis.1